MEPSLVICKLPIIDERYDKSFRVNLICDSVLSCLHVLKLNKINLLSLVCSVPKSRLNNQAVQLNTN